MIQSVKLLGCMCNMEELRSTENLDREILEDARKKAFKILANADESVTSQSKRWEMRIQKAVKEIENAYEQRTQMACGEIVARGLLDKRRLRSEISEKFLKETLDEFLKNLKRGDLLSILKKELEIRLAECGDEIVSSDEPALTFHHISEAEIKNMLCEIFDNRKISGSREIKNWPVSNTAKTQFGFPAVVINTSRLRITASVENAANKLLLDKRSQLVSSLLGAEALND